MSVSEQRPAILLKLSPAVGLRVGQGVDEETLWLLTTLILNANSRGVTSVLEKLVHTFMFGSTTRMLSLRVSVLKSSTPLQVLSVCQFIDF